MAAWPEGSGGMGEWERGASAREQELALEDDDRLPWLESDEEDEPAAYDTGRLVGLGLIMLVVLALLVGGIWFLTHRGLSDGPPPDGSLIAAPEGPFKVRPTDPGGKIFPGTGDTSFAVGEGKTVEGRIANNSGPPSPIASLAASPKATASPTATPTVDAGLPAGTAVQVGAYSSKSDAETGWRTLMRQTSLLNGVHYRIIEGHADIGRVYRLQAVGGDHAGAVQLCAKLSAEGIACQVK